MAVMIYALFTYHVRAYDCFSLTSISHTPTRLQWRAQAIRRRGSGPYDDRLGPTVLCFALLGGSTRTLLLAHLVA